MTIFQDVKSILYFDHGEQKTICPVKDGLTGVVIANFIPKYVNLQEKGLY